LTFFDIAKDSLQEKSEMNNAELAALAREILDTAELDEASEDGVITVNPDLLFQYSVMRGVAAEQGEI
jgi:hypothetical protein